MRILIFVILLLVSSEANGQTWKKNLSKFERITNRISFKELSGSEYSNLYSQYLSGVFVSENAEIDDFLAYYEDQTREKRTLKDFAPDLMGYYLKTEIDLESNLRSARVIRISNIHETVDSAKYDRNGKILPNLKVFSYAVIKSFKGEETYERDSLFLTFNLFCYGQIDKNCKIVSIEDNYARDFDDDKDGFLEKGIHFRDKCPGQYGTASGCPDQDGDGFYEVRLTEANSFDPFYDLCPMEFGTTQGCADQDADGILDKDERKECINIRGDIIEGPYSSYNGCPDTDHDGVPDTLDNCKNEYGTINSESETINGCPNLDGDFLSDANDDCPCDEGPIETFGCPDQDQDGILDDEDNCPNEKGTSADGCVEEFYSRQNSEQVFDPDDPINFLEIIDNEILIIGTLNGMLGVLPINENEEAFNLSRANKRNVGVLLGVVYSDSGLDEGKVYVVSQRYGKPQKTELKINRGVAVEILETISASVKEFEKYEEEIRNKEIDVDTEDNQIFVQSSLEVEGGSNIPIRDTLSFQSEIDVDESVMTISKDGKYLAFAESKEDYDLRIWKRTNRKFKRLPQKWIEMENPKIKLKNGHFPRSLVFTKNGDRIFIGTQHGYLYSFKKR